MQSHPASHVKPSAPDAENGFVGLLQLVVVRGWKRRRLTCTSAAPSHV